MISTTLNRWPWQRLKSVASVTPSGVDKRSNPDERPVQLCNYVDVYRNDRITDAIPFMEATASATEIERLSLMAGDVLLTKDSETPEDIAVPAYVESTAEGVVCGYHLALLRPRLGRMSGHFLFWSLKSPVVAAQFTVRAQGVTRFGLTVGGTGEVRLPVPPPDEQQAIADFLDREVGLIDALAAAYGQLLETLEEKRRKVVAQAVTKGLTPAAPMKNSGIEWLGDVPEHWKTVSLGKVTTQKCDGPFGSALKTEHYTDSGVRVIRLQNIRDGEFSGGDAAYIDDEYYRTSIGGHDVIKDDILIAGLGDDNNYVGRACVAPDDIAPAMVKADCFRFRLNQKKAVPEFVAAQLMAGAQYAAGTLSYGATRSRIPLSATATRKLALPPIDEQREIVRFLAQSSGEIADTIATINKATTALLERRAALITAAVTGQIDVRTRNAAMEAA